jgi:hypothetical protein
MTAFQRRLYKLSFIALLIFSSSFTTGCSFGGFLLQKKDLATVNNRLTGIENDLRRQSSQISSLLEECRNEQQLLTERMEENARLLKNLEDLIKQNHRETCRKFAANRKKHTAESDPEAQPSPPLKPTGMDKLLVGRVEKVRLTPPGRTFHARIDTGATSSSLDARDIETFERDGDDWVRFKIKDPESEDFYEVERPIIRWSKIIQASSDEADRRPVIELQLELGTIKLIEEFNLEDRAHLNYEVLIGRNVLRDLMVVDVSQKFLNDLPEIDTNRNGAK